MLYSFHVWHSSKHFSLLSQVSILIYIISPLPNPYFKSQKSTMIHTWLNYFSKCTTFKAGRIFVPTFSGMIFAFAKKKKKMFRKSTIYHQNTFIVYSLLLKRCPRYKVVMAVVKRYASEIWLSHTK